MYSVLISSSLSLIFFLLVGSEDSLRDPLSTKADSISFSEEFFSLFMRQQDDLRPSIFGLKRPNNSGSYGFLWGESKSVTSSPFLVTLTQYHSAISSMDQWGKSSVLENLKYFCLLVTQIPTRAPGARRQGTGSDFICHNDMKEYLEKIYKNYVKINKIRLQAILGWWRPGWGKRNNE